MNTTGQAATGEIMVDGRQGTDTGSIAPILHPHLGHAEAQAVLLDEHADKPRWWRDRLRRRLLGAADLSVTTTMACAVSFATGDPLVVCLLAVPFALLVAKVMGLYDSDHRAIRHLTIDEFPAVTAWAGITLVATLLIGPRSASATDIFLIFVCITPMALAARAFSRWAWRTITPPERTIVVGDGPPAEAIMRKIDLFDDMHLELAAVHGTQRHIGAAAVDVSEMDRLFRGSDRIILACEMAHPKLIERMFTACRRLEIKLSVVSPFHGRARPAPRLTQVADLPVLEYNTWDIPRSTALLKRAFDVVFAGAASLVLAPVFALIALGIKFDDRGPVFFRQPRAGQDGVPFVMLKFRSMTEDAEARLVDLVNLDELADPMFKLRSDPRTTRVGRFLRRYSLDEMPQIFNVLKGDMSIVGPRPEEMLVVSRYRPEHRVRLELKPGLTGPMQVFGRGELSFNERLAVELDYQQNLSVLRDIRLVALTIPAVVRGKGAY